MCCAACRASSTASRHCSSAATATTARRSACRSQSIPHLHTCHCTQLLRYASVTAQDVRELAAAIYYLLMRKNFEDSNKMNDVSGANCTRVKVQSTIAISEVESALLVA